MFLIPWRKLNDRGKPGAGGGRGRSLAELEKEIERAKMLNKQLQEQVCHVRKAYLDEGIRVMWRAPHVALNRHMVFRP